MVIASYLTSSLSTVSNSNLIAMETWKEIKFEFDTVDKLDVK